jgi:hypothetical protein
MKFRDFFLPKIARSDPNVRIKAVLAENNPDLLKKVIQNDSDKNVCEAAKDRLKQIES